MRFKSGQRAVFACWLLGIVFTGFSARLIHLQVGKHAEYSALAAQKNSITQTIPARRGSILDRNGEVLAANVPVRRVVIDGTRVNNAAKLAELAAPYFNMSAADLERDLLEAGPYKILTHDLAEEKFLALQKQMQAASLRGLYFYPNNTRIYPNGSMLSHVIGFMSRKNPSDEFLAGVEGIERLFDEELHGQDGFRHIERDRTGREIVIYRGQEQAPHHGSQIALTIDMGLQAILENELDAAYGELKPQTAVGIMVNPKTGEILAMANRPAFDPNAISSSRPEQMKNRAILDMVEPGSTFKIVVASAALNERVVNDKSQIFCENGSFLYAGRILRDHHGYGNMSVFDILVKSSNIGSAKMALMMGGDKYYEYVRRFGFGERTGVELPGEIPGLVHPPHRWDKLTITRMPMGHSVAVTPLQMVMAMSVVANGGKLMKPQIVHTIRDEHGNVVRDFQPEVVREVIPENVAHYVSSALKGVTARGGTATLAQVAGFDVAGKTGTAQKVDPKGGYAPGKYVVSFLGYMPADDPEFVCLIMIDDAKLSSGMNYGGLVAAPIFSRVAEKAARYMNLIPAQPAVPVLPVAMSPNPSSATRSQQ